MKLLVTGARGFISRAIAREAETAGHAVFRMSRHEMGRDSSLSLSTSANSDVLARYLDELEPDAIFHGAGTASVGASLNDPLADLSASVGSWSALLEAVRRSTTRPLIIYPSSAAVYGDPEMLPTNEDAELRPISPYGFHKLICEVLAREYNQCFGLKVVCCRYFSVFGAEQRRLLIWDLYEKLRSGTPSIELRGTGKESRDFLLVDDLANATVAVATKALSTQNAFPDVLNIASGSEISIAEVSEVMREITGAKDVTVNFDQRRSNIDPAKWRADISLFQSTVGELRNRGFQKVLEMTVKTWDEQGKQKSADIM